MVVSARVCVCVCVCVFSADESGDELAMKRFYDDKLHDAAQPSQRRSVSTLCSLGGGGILSSERFQSL